MSGLHLPANVIAYGLRDVRNLRDVLGRDAALSLLDCEAFGFAFYGGGEPFLNAHRDFAGASIRFRRGGNDDAAWRDLIAAADRLATFLDPLGNAAVSHCERPSAGGHPCDAIIHNGRCTSSHGHLDDLESQP